MTKPTGLSHTQHAVCSPSNSTSHTKEDDLPSSDYLKNTAIPEDTAPVVETSTPNRSTYGSNELEKTQNLRVQENCDGTVQSCSSGNEGKSLNDTSSFQTEQDDLKYKTGDGASSTVSETKPDLADITSDMEIKTSSDVLKNGAKPKDTVPLVETFTAERPTNERNGLGITPNLSVQEHCDGMTGVQTWTILPDTSSFQEEKCLLNSPVMRLCQPRPFDESYPTFEYTQNEFLPPETGPSNLIDPVHEYKLLVNTGNASEEDVLQKFTNDTFRFAAGCMNSRTNGTIHFGVSDEPHGQIIGIVVKSLKKYVEAFDRGFEKHFQHNINILKMCIRPPKFFKVKCPDNVDKWVIEIDVVPVYELTGEKRFYTVLDKKMRKSKSFFIRDGASTINYTPEKKLKRTKQYEKNLSNNVKLWALNRKLAQERHRLRTRDVTVCCHFLFA